MTSWVDGAGGSPYDADNLPYGVFSRDGEEPRVGARIGDYLLDLAPVAATEMLDVHAVFGEPTLNELLRALIKCGDHAAALQTYLHSGPKTAGS